MVCFSLPPPQHPVVVLPPHIGGFILTRDVYNKMCEFTGLWNYGWRDGLPENHPLQISRDSGSLDYPPMWQIYDFEELFLQVHGLPSLDTWRNFIEGHAGMPDISDTTACLEECLVRGLVIEKYYYV
jgi:hypothetical protein